MARNLKRLRGDLSLRELEDKLDELEVKISSSGLQKIESGSRRVDADEIIALSVALNVNPNALLLPDFNGDVDMSDDVTAVAEGTTGDDIWAWADGWCALPQHRSNAPEVDESASGMERGRQEAKRRRVTEGWDFLGRIRPQSEVRTVREFLAKVAKQVGDHKPGEWLSLWWHSGQEKSTSSRVAAWPESGWTNMDDYLARMKTELAGINNSTDAEYVKRFEQDQPNGND